jgi:hypothetical protein
MNLARAQRRVDRSYWRAIKAVSPCWQRAWLKGFGAAVSARNAIRAVSFVRHPAGNRDFQIKQPLARGAAGGGSGVVVPLPLNHEPHTTTSVIDRATGEKAGA